MKDFLDSDQIFVKGQYKGENLEDVAMDDPDYLKFILKKHELNEEEEELMKKALEAYEEK